MIVRYFLGIFTLFAAISHAQVSATYRPLGAALETTAFQRWESLRQSIHAPVANGSRPVLPGVTSRNLELLQDAVARKYHRVTSGSSLPIAREVLSRTTRNSLPKLRGTMAEAIFLDRNSDWNYISKPNASQHDVYAKMPAGRPGLRTGQVKYHVHGVAATYARDMLKDYRSGNFFVPDDHVDELRTYLRMQGDRLRVEGNSADAAAKYRDMNRVKGVGATSVQIDRATRQAINEARILRVTPYAFMGVMSALIIVPTGVDWHQGNIETPEAFARLGRGASGVLSGVVADQTLRRWKGGLLRGTTRGNAIVACVVLLVDTSWQATQHGGIGNAFRNPDFLIDLGGGIGATGCALLGTDWGVKGGAVIALAAGQAGPQAAAPEEVVTVPIGAVIGGLVGGVFGGCVGYFGGAEGTRWFMANFCPEKLYEQERVHIENVREGIAQRISALKKI